MEPFWSKIFPKSWWGFGGETPKLEAAKNELFTAGKLGKNLKNRVKYTKYRDHHFSIVNWEMGVKFPLILSKKMFDEHFLDSGKNALKSPFWRPNNSFKIKYFLQFCSIFKKYLEQILMKNSKINSNLINIGWYFTLQKTKKE